MSKNKTINSIESLIKKLDGPNENPITPEKTEEYVYSLLNKIDSILPEWLYKYREGKQRDIDALKNMRLYLSRPEGFNDPTESMAYVDTDKLVSFALCMRNDSSIFASLNEDVENNYLDKRIELLNKSLSYIQENRKRVKICCLSEVIKSPLMWSHYAQDHKGFAIRYKTNMINVPECGQCNETDFTFCHRQYKPIFPVVYKDTRYDASHVAFARTIHKEMEKDVAYNEYPFPLLTVLQKSKEWEYEKEWRIICNNTNNTYFSIKPDAVFLGERINDKSACELAQIARNQGLQLYKMCIDYFTPNFELGYEDWTNYSDEEIKELVHEDAPKFGL